MPSDQTGQLIELVEVDVQLASPMLQLRVGQQLRQVGGRRRRDRLGRRFGDSAGSAMPTLSRGSHRMLANRRTAQFASQQFHGTDQLTLARGQGDRACDRCRGE
jgi:hypothetical protein